LDPRISRWLSRTGKLCWAVNVLSGRRAIAAKAHTAGGLLTGLSSSRAKRAFQRDLDALVQFSAFVDRGMMRRSDRIPDFRAPRPAARKFNPGLPFAFRVTSTPIRIKR